MKKIGESKRYPYAVEQIIDPTLKCKDGENLFEVKERMKQTINRIVNNNLGNKVVVVSHGAAIKFYLRQWCEFKGNKLYYNKVEIRIKSPSIVKITFNKEELQKIELIS